MSTASLADNLRRKDPVKNHALARTGNAQVMSSDRFHNDMVKLAHQSPSDAADVAETWRSRFLNAAEATQTAATKVIEVITASTLSFGMGLFDGQANARKRSLMIDWDAKGKQEALEKYLEKNPDADVTIDSDMFKTPFERSLTKDMGGKTDPTALFGIPYTLLATFVVSALAIFNVGQKVGISNYIQAGALGAISYWTGMAGYDTAYDARFKKSQPNAVVSYTVSETDEAA